MSAEYGLCLTCYEVIDPLVYARGDYNICPKMNCNHELIFIDELMIPIIITLNKKGYETQECCSSHLWDADLYIDFQPGIIIPKTLPHGLFLHTKAIQEDFAGIGGPDMANQKIQNTIRTDWECYKKWSTLSMIEKQKIIFKHITMLLEWADKLPDLTEEVYHIHSNDIQGDVVVDDLKLKEKLISKFGYLQYPGYGGQHLWFKIEKLDNISRIDGNTLININWPIDRIIEVIIRHEKEERI